MSKLSNEGPSIRMVGKRSSRRAWQRGASVLGVLVLLAAAPARAGSDASDADGGREGEAGLGVAAGLISLVYAPAKVVYAVGGGVVAGLAYVLSAGNQDVTDPILTPALRGDYVVTPAHLRGERPLEFIGREPEEPAASHAAQRSSGDGLDAVPSVASGAGAPPAESR